ncbi:MAG TPA: MFS transporter [Ktedonobacteraceae bacterium]|nr:MFS transporter [Ktedonobacteraceae bacterium]
MAESSLPGDARIPADLSASDVRATDLPEALQAPTRRVGAGFQVLFLLANIVTWLAKFPFTQIVLPLQILAFDPGNKVADLAIITGVGSFFGLVVNPIAGALSDRTTRAWGRRRPWLIAGGLLSAVVLVLLAYAPGVIGLLIEWIVYQIVVNAVLAALLATIPDQVPRSQRGTVSAYTGLSYPLGLILGTLLVTRVLKSAIAPSYYVIAAIFLVVIVAFALILPDKQLARGIMPSFHLGRFLASFWISPRRYPDFAWAWITRFLLIMSSAVVTVYLLYYLQDVLHFSTGLAAQRATTFNSIYGVILIVFAFLSGFVSDRIQRRKIFVMSAGIIVAVSMLILAFVTSWAGVLVAAAIFGLGYGVYIAVDIALITEVLPSAGDRGKDMGVFNIANSLPQVIVPIIAVITVSSFHNYSVLFVVVAIAAVLSGVLIAPIKGVR